MTFENIMEKLEKAERLNKDKVNEVKQKFNKKMEEARIEFQKQSKEGEKVVSQASFNR